MVKSYQASKEVLALLSEFRFHSRISVVGYACLCIVFCCLSFMTFNSRIVSAVFSVPILVFIGRLYYNTLRQQPMLISRLVLSLDIDKNELKLSTPEFGPFITRQRPNLTTLPIRELTIKEKQFPLLDAKGRKLEALMISTEKNGNFYVLKSHFGSREILSVLEKKVN